MLRNSGQENIKWKRRVYHDNLKLSYDMESADSFPAKFVIRQEYAGEFGSFVCRVEVSYNDQKQFVTCKYLREAKIFCEGAYVVALMAKLEEQGARLKSRISENKTIS